MSVVDFGVNVDFLSVKDIIKKKSIWALYIISSFWFQPYFSV